MKTIEEMAIESGGGIGTSGRWLITQDQLEAFAKLVEAPLRSDIEELLQENTLLRARNDRLEAQAQQKPLEKFECAYGYSQCQALTQPQQEPVAWDGDCVLGHCGSPAGCESSNCCRANYTPPPQRTWVGLTDEKFLELMLQTGTQELIGVATFVGDSIQMQGKIGLLRSAKIIKEFVEAAYGIKE